MMSEHEPLSLRQVEAAKMLGVSPRTLWTWTSEGRIPCVRIGTGKRQLTLYPVESLKSWLRDQATGNVQKGGEA